MYTLNQLIEKLDDKDSFKTEEISSYIKSWRIDPVYEDESKIEYFDELAIQKLNNAIGLKKQGKPDLEIMTTVNKEIFNPIKAPAIRPIPIPYQNHSYQKRKNNKITLEVTSQTLSLLADSIACKISDDITNKLNENNPLKPISDTGKIKKNNEFLTNQVKRLTEENKTLLYRINFLQQENAKFKHLIGSIYKKEG